MCNNVKYVSRLSNWICHINGHENGFLCRYILSHRQDRNILTLCRGLSAELLDQR